MSRIHVTGRRTSRSTTKTQQVTGLVETASTSDSQSDKCISGYGGRWLGARLAVTPNIFLRGEYEYVRFFGLDGLKLYLNTARVGAGIKF